MDEPSNNPRSRELRPPIRDGRRNHGSPKNQSKRASVDDVGERKGRRAEEAEVRRELDAG